LKKLKNILISIFVLLITLNALLQYKLIAYLKTISNIIYLDSVIMLIIGYFLAVLIAYIVHLIAFGSTDEDIKKETGFFLIEIFKFLIQNHLISLIAPDFILAKFFKTKFKENEYYEEFVEKSNYLNVILVVLIAFINMFSSINGMFIFKSFFAFHIISRIFEITYAFYNDITDDENNSGLKSNQRISLAVNSYFEIIILGGIFYYLFSDQLLKNLGQNNFIDYLIYSGTVSTFNFGFNEDTTVQLKTITLIQVFSSLNLVILSVAKYVSEKNNGEEED